jgi:nicotinate-nucleotide pyrophosphorylase (carboxylating)
MHALPEDIASIVANALREDVGSGDLTAGLIANDVTARAKVIAREEAILCGSAWFDEVYKQLDNSIVVQWLASDGNTIKPDQTVCQVTGTARAVLTGERTALNFLQTLSGTATVTHEFVKLLDGLDTRILDTRKTVPGLRKAQKYAVLCGGGFNHRTGLYDAILIKENHIAAAGSIKAVMMAAQQHAVPVEIEVENLQQLEEALTAGADSVLLDNFDLDNLRQAVRINQGRAKLEASGAVEQSTLRSIAETGVDYVSIGSLTKHVRAIDFTLRFIR